MVRMRGHAVRAANLNASARRAGQTGLAKLPIAAECTLHCSRGSRYYTKNVTLNFRSHDYFNINSIRFKHADCAPGTWTLHVTRQARTQIVEKKNSEQ